jgi:hypothetical protein
MRNTFREIYESLKANNPDTPDNVLKQRAWVLRDRYVYESSYNNNAAAASSSAGAGGGGSIQGNNYVERDYIENGYFE